VAGFPLAILLSLVLWVLVGLTCYGVYKLLT
jgi:uncharacterized membrane protein